MRWAPRSNPHKRNSFLFREALCARFALSLMKPDNPGNRQEGMSMASKRSSVAHQVRALHSVTVVAAILVLSGSLLLCACGGGSSAKTPPAISVSLTPSAQTKIDLGQTLDFTASVSNDSSGKGVTWAASGTGCSGSACARTVHDG